MNEMKSLTLNGKTYDSFPDKTAVKTINGIAPDTMGNVATTDGLQEILGFSQTAIPKLFILEFGDLSEAAVESDSEHRCRSDFFKVDTAFEYHLLIDNTTDSNQTLCYYSFDENKNLIGARINIPVAAGTQKKQTVYLPAGTKYVRLLVTKGLKDCLVRFYAKEQIEHATKSELKVATYGTPRTLDMLDCFGPGKKVVLVGDSFTQGLGTTGLLHYESVDADGNPVTITGNGYDYGILHALPSYESGMKLYAHSGRVWHEAVSGNGYAHRLKNFLQNKYGCTVKNYAMSGITTATLLGQTMNSENSDLTGDGASVSTILNTQDDWMFGEISVSGELQSSSQVIRTASYIPLSEYSGNVTVSTTGEVPFRVAYYNDAYEFVGWAANWVTEGSLTLDKTVAPKALVKVMTTDLANYARITITAENVGNIRVIEGVTNGFDTVFLTIGGNDRGFADYVSPSTGETVTGKDIFRANLRQLVEYILGEGKNLILMSMTPCADDSEKNVPMWDIDDVIGELATEYGVPFISNYQRMLEYCDNTGTDIDTLRNADGLHPNDEGHAVIEAIICEELGINWVDKKYVDQQISEVLKLLAQRLQIEL